MRLVPTRSSRIRRFLRRHGVKLALAAVAPGAAFGLSRGGPATAVDWEAAAAQVGLSVATPRDLPPDRARAGAAVAALPDAYRHIVPASAADPAPVPASELWPAQ